MGWRQPDETLEKLSRGIEESRRTAQRQAIELAQEYFGDSVEVLKQQIEESRSRLESLPDEVSGGRDETFQALFEELIESYSRLENCLDEAEKNVAGMDLERLEGRKGVSEAILSQGVEATDAAYREAQRRGVDLDDVGGSGTGGRVVAEDVRSDEERQTGRPEATDAARREARRLGLDLSEVEATGAEGQIIISDVVEFAEQAANFASDTAATGAQEGPGLVLQSQAPDSQAAVQAGSAVEETEARIDQAASESSGGEPRTIDAARRKAEDLGVSLSDVAGTDSRGQSTISEVTGVAEDDSGAVERSAGQIGTSGEPAATKAARRRAEKLGVDLSRIEGSGTRGLITISDVLKAHGG
jgi:pyruvate/2-oxoglutarate dehydrogenase complex dihydrolipoamide acyltransferase (E2) component